MASNFSKYNALKTMVAVVLPKKPKIGGYAVVGRIYDYEDRENSGFELVGVFSNLDEALTKAALFEKLTGLRLGFGARIESMTQSLVDDYKSGKAKWISQSPEWIGYETVTINGEHVASTYKEANPLKERLQEEHRGTVADLLDKKFGRYPRHKLSNKEQFLVAFSAAAAMVARRGKGLAVFITNAVKAIAPSLSAKAPTNKATNKPNFPQLTM